MTFFFKKNGAAKVLQPQTPLHNQNDYKIKEGDQTKTLEKLFHKPKAW
jgi:hypothetical protein